MKNENTHPAPASLIGRLIKPIKDAWSSYIREVDFMNNGYRSYEDMNEALCCANGGNYATKEKAKPKKQVAVFDDYFTTY